MNKNIYLIDFDITVTKRDTTHTLLETFIPHLLEEIRGNYRAGRLSIREFIQNGLGSLCIDKDTYISTLQKKIDIDETFLSFIKDVDFRIVSAGTKLNVSSVLAKYGIILDDDHIISNEIYFEDKIRIEMPYMDNARYYGVDKKEQVEKYKKMGYIVTFIGDGPSDYEAISAADYVFVRKGTRAVKYCIDNNIEFKEFDNFNEIERRNDVK